MRMPILKAVKEQKLNQTDMLRECELMRNKALIACAFLGNCVFGVSACSCRRKRLDLKYPLASNKGKILKVQTCVGRNMDDAMNVLVQANPALYAEMWPFLSEQVVYDVYLMV